MKEKKSWKNGYRFRMEGKPRQCSFIQIFLTSVCKHIFIHLGLCDAVMPVNAFKKLYRQRIYMYQLRYTCSHLDIDWLCCLNLPKKNQNPAMQMLLLCQIRFIMYRLNSIMFCFSFFFSLYRQYDALYYTAESLLRYRNLSKFDECMDNKLFCRTKILTTEKQKLDQALS